ncbi:histidine phosphatase family protein [Flavobacterium sp.]|uniref:SixA phosphatase family protein n=1 Tax=Flavobacterium sp. TaxID=239 RepID=UPI002631C85B|nr:histidine phosphatase family protein [Flavobacterium sp.]MDG2433561.1 histidine phosphatase family protein [Flavobacterium sp.]
MKNLILIRHAKSSWDSPVNDIDRLLEKRGIDDAHLVSSNVHEFLPKSFTICSSTAKRAASTAIIFAQNIHFPVESIVFSKQLYTFDGKQLEKIIKSFDKVADNVILFGHNAAITDFVNKFGDVLITNVPTAGFVSISFDTNCWTKISKGKTNKIVNPKDLK